MDGQRAGIGIAVLALQVAFAVGRVLVKQEGLAELDEFFHAFVAAGEQSFAGFVFVNDGAGPATETGVAATGRAGVNLNGTFAAARVGVEFVERAVVVTPRVRVLQEISPDFFGGEEFDGV